MPNRLTWCDLPADVSLWPGLPLSLSGDEVMPLDYRAGRTGWLLYGRGLDKQKLTDYQHQLGAAMVMVVFAYSGVETALIPGGEVRDPSRSVPRAALSAILLVVLLYLGLQIVCQGVLGPALATSSVPIAMTTDDVTTAVQRRAVRIGSDIGRGGCCMTFATGLSKASAIAGGPSMMMFTQRIAIAAKGLPSAMPKIDAIRNNAEKPIAVDNWKRTNETMLW